MESKAIKLAKKIATILNGEEYDDAVSALKIAKIMLPSPSVQRKKQQTKKKQEEESELQRATEGSLVPADEELMNFSKVMNKAIPQPKPAAEIDEDIL